MSIYHLNKSSRCIIEKMPEIALLKSLGLRTGMTVSIKSRLPFGGPIVVQMGNRSIAVARDIAKDILVKQVV